MPATRPEAVSNCVRLSNEVGAAVLGLVAEDGAIDALLPTAVEELPPDEHGVAALSAEDNLLPRSNKLRFTLLPGLSEPRVVASVQLEAGAVSVAGKPPDWFSGHSGSVAASTADRSFPATSRSSACDAAGSASFACSSILWMSFDAVSQKLAMRLRWRKSMSISLFAVILRS